LGVEVRQGDEQIEISEVTTSHLVGANGDMRNAMAYVARHESDNIKIDQA